METQLSTLGLPAARGAQQQRAHLEATSSRWALAGLVLAVVLGIALVFGASHRYERLRAYQAQQHREMMLREMVGLRDSLVKIQATGNPVPWIPQEIARLNKQIEKAQRGGR